ncbi:hypothetical protein D3C75_548560 [compost metagenome]
MESVAAAALYRESVFADSGIALGYNLYIAVQKLVLPIIKHRNTLERYDRIILLIDPSGHICHEVIRHPTPQFMAGIIDSGNGNILRKVCIALQCVLPVA